MKRVRYFGALALIFASSAPILAQDAAEVRAVIERHYAAIHSNDLAAVFEQHLPEMTWFPTEGRVMFESGAAEAAERMGATLDYGTINVYMSHFNAQIYGNVAVATFYLVGPRELEGETTNSTSRVTAVWVREGGEWKEAHHHESPLAGKVHP